jgi:NTE family protein
VETTFHKGDAMKKRRTYDHEILLLQGGGALGAYQCGVYEGLAEVDVTPTWFVGISIGAVNSALLAGNPPERRLDRLRTFWDRASEFNKFELPSWLEPMRPMLGRLNFATVAAWGIPGFFKPRTFPPDLATSGTPEALSYYDTAPLKSTLEELVDFDLINRRAVRLSLGAVNVRTGESVYFDNHKTRIGPEHVMASGALPPGFPAICIDGEHYYDGGIVSNSPLTYVWDEKPLTSALILHVNLFNAHGALPRTLDEAMERVKDIQFASKQRLNTQRVRELMEMRVALGRLLAKLPPDLAADPDARKLAPLCDNRDWTIAHINNRRPARGGQTKDAEFSRSVVNERWAAGLEDVRFSAAMLEWTQPLELGGGVRVYYLPPAAPSIGSAGSGPAALGVADTPEEPGDKPHDTRPRRSA